MVFCICVTKWRFRDRSFTISFIYETYTELKSIHSILNLSMHRISTNSSKNSYWRSIFRKEIRVLLLRKCQYLISNEMRCYAFVLVYRFSFNKFAWKCRHQTFKNCCLLLSLIYLITLLKKQIIDKLILFYKLNNRLF